jgi:hypothetical protein
LLFTQNYHHISTARYLYVFLRQTELFKNMCTIISVPLKKRMVPVYRKHQKFKNRWSKVLKSWLHRIRTKTNSQKHKTAEAGPSLRPFDDTDGCHFIPFINLTHSLRYSLQSAGHMIQRNEHNSRWYKQLTLSVIQCIISSFWRHSYCQKVQELQAFCEGFKLLLVLTKKLTERKNTEEKRKKVGVRDRPHPTCLAYSSSLLEIVELRCLSRLSL